MSLVPHDSCRGVQHTLPATRRAGHVAAQGAAFTFLVRHARTFSGEARCLVHRRLSRAPALLRRATAPTARAHPAPARARAAGRRDARHVGERRRSAAAGADDCAARRALLARLRQRARTRSRGRRGTSSSASTSASSSADDFGGRCSARSSAPPPSSACRCSAAALRRHAVRPGRGAAEGGAALDLARLPLHGPQRLLGFAAYFAAPLRAREGTTPLPPPPTPTPPRPSTRASASRSTPPAPARSSSTRASTAVRSGREHGRANAPPTPGRAAGR